MDVFNLAAKIMLDTSEYEKGLDGAGEKTRSFGSKIAGGLGTAAKAGAAAITVASGAVVALSKNAIEGYADYEQLVGGVETLFGAGGKTLEEYAASVGKTVEEARSEYNKLISSQEAVLENASNAYKTAGLSANEYMETVTSFSASLLQSLSGDTEKAAQVSDMAISDMADNANKMGTSMEAIQNAYQGFAKANYTMLDNLKLGYGGTKSEMERLLEDATKLSGVEYDIESLADVYEAIHVIQDELGITGTTAKEASETISGSISAMRSAWQNLVVGIADDNADFDSLISNFVESATTVAGNILPRVEQALEGVGKLVENLAPVIASAIPTLVSNVLPTLLESAVSLIESVGKVIFESLPMLLKTGVNIVIMIANGISQNLPTLIPAIVEVVLLIVDTLTDPKNISALLEAAIDIVVALGEGLIKALPLLIAKAPIIIGKLLEAIITAAVKLLAAGVEIVGKVVAGIIGAFPKLLNVGTDAINKVKEGFMKKIEDAKNWGKDLIKNFIGGIKEKGNDLKEAVSGAAGKVKKFLGFSEPEEGPLSNFHTYAPDMMKLFAQGIKENEHLVTSQIEDSFNFGAVGSLTPAFAGDAGNIGYDQQTLVEALTEAMKGISVEVMIGQDRIDDMVRKSIQRYNYMSGGR